MGAVDHARALDRSIFGEYPLTTAPWLCARAVLEVACTSSWLLDPKIDSHERLTRGMIADFQDLNSARRYFDNAGHSDQVSHIDAEMATILARADPLGLSKRVKKEKSPNISERINNTLSETKIYNLLSGAAHGNPRVTLSLGAVPAGEPITHMVPRLSPKSARWLIVCVSHWLAQPLWDRYLLFGWNVNKVTPLLEEAYDLLNINDDNRFWRQR